VLDIHLYLVYFYLRMTTVNNNGQRKTRTVHIAVSLKTLRELRRFASIGRRSINAQGAWAMELGLRCLDAAAKKIDMSEVLKEIVHGNQK
jgi:hypothetical protein